MSNKIKILSSLMILISLFCMASCGEEDEITPANYERPVATMARAITAMDTEAYLNCFTSDEKQEYINSDNYNEELVKTFLPSQSENKRILKTKTISDKELGQDKIDQLKQQYKDDFKKRVDITKARQLKVEFILQGDKEQKATVNLTVVWIENRWYVYGDVVEKFEFEKTNS